MLYTGEYTTIDWPESQEYMDEDWFPTEAIATAQSGTYLVPSYRLELESVNSTIPNYRIPDQ